MQWAIEKTKLKAYQNTFEMLFISSLRRCLPKKWKVVIVADRGFQRADFLDYLNQQGFSFVIRVKGDAWAECARYKGKLRDYPLSVGRTRRTPNTTPLRSE
jgi:hypothetical protein